MQNVCISQVVQAVYLQAGAHACTPMLPNAVPPWEAERLSSGVTSSNSTHTHLPSTPALGQSIPLRFGEAPFLCYHYNPHLYEDASGIKHVKQPLT